jgi:hypothetical protein
MQLLSQFDHIVTTPVVVSFLFLNVQPGYNSLETFLPVSATDLHGRGGVTIVYLATMKAISAPFKHVAVAALAILAFEVLFANSCMRRPATMAPSRQLKVLMWNRYDAAALKGADIERALYLSGKNIGNWVWQYAAQERILDVRGIDVILGSEAYVPEMHRYLENGTDKIDLIYWPTANILTNKSHSQKYRHDYVMRHRRFFDLLRAPALILGIGVDFPFDAASHETKDIGDDFERISVPSDMVLDPDFADVISNITREVPLVATRGKFTEQVCINHGINNARDLGCPTLFISADPAVGHVLARKIRALSDNPKLAITFHYKYTRKLMQLLISLLLANPDSIAVSQDKRDQAALAQAMSELAIDIPTHRVRSFTSLQEWRDNICAFDALIGPRIHGSMIGFFCPIPMLVITMDLRVDELAKSMRIPHLRLDSHVFKRDDVRLSAKELFEASNFDPEEFDRNRYHKANQYRQHLDAMRLPASPLIRMLGHMHQRTTT